MKIGDTVSCIYHGMELTGKIDSYDFSGVYVTLETPVEIYGTLREGVYLNKNSVRTLKLVKSNDPVECEYFQGYVWAKGESK